MEKNTTHAKKPHTIIKGIEQMGITVYETDTGYVIAQKMIQWLKRYIINMFFDFQSEDGQSKAIEWANGSHSKVELVDSKDISPSDLFYYERLVKSFSDNPALGLLLFQKKHFPSQVAVTGPDGTNKYWTCLNGKITAHGKGGKLNDETNRPFTPLADFSTLLAETYFRNHLYNFVQQNTKPVRREIVKFCYSMQTDKSSVLVPSEEMFREEFVHVARQHLNPSVYLEDEKMERFRSTWEMKDIMQPFFLNMAMPSYIKTFPKIKIKGLKELPRPTKVYETNLTIKAPIRALMKDNAFLKSYGKVELHNDLNIKKFKRMEEDFESLKKIIPIPYCKDYTLRIKKLGSHKAEGIHYPSLKNIVLDVRYVDSYVHELGHQLDIIWGKDDKRLSDLEHFKPIINGYKMRLNKELSSFNNDDDDDDEDFIDETRRNKEYFLEPKEIFARCFEIYINEFISDNCLAKDSLPSLHYPNDVFFRKHVILYFSRLLNIQKNTL